MTDPSRDVDPNQLSDTVADEELAPDEESPPAPMTPPVTRQLHRDQRPPRRHDEDIGLVERPIDRRRALAITRDVDLDRIFDKGAQGEENPAGRYDPEAGKGDVAVKISAATEAAVEAVKSVATGAISTPFGRLILSIFVAMAGIALVIAAVTIQEHWMIAGAAVVAPLGLLLVYWRYRAWLGHKRYIYRLLESLGEDVSDFSPDQAYRRTKVRPARRRRR
jgi:hypothetical protein